MRNYNNQSPRMPRKLAQIMPAQLDKPERQLASRRIELGLNQGDLNKLTGISTTQISRMERSEIDPTYDEAGIFAKALNSTRQKLFPDIVWTLTNTAAKWQDTEGAIGL